MRRLIDAALNSVRAWSHLVRYEAAFRLEVMLLAAAIPVGWVLSTTWRGYALLISSILLLMLVEVLNTAVEAACDAFSREFNVDIRLAKDCGSLAVTIAALMAAIAWGFAVAERIAGTAL